MTKRLTDGDKKMINCYAFQHAEENISTGVWNEGIAEMYLNLVAADPDLFVDLLEGGAV